MPISLKEITRETLREVCRLDAGDGARQVAPNALSIAEASFYDEAWFRAIYDDETPVGFICFTTLRSPNGRKSRTSSCGA